MTMDKSVTTEIREAFDSLRENNSVVPKGWVVQTVMAAHPGIEGADRDFAIYCATTHLSEKLFRGMKAATEVQGQFILPGFDHVQSFYIVQRNGEPVAVRVHDLTDEEIDAKAAEHLSAAAGHKAHAEELLRFKQRRLAGAA